MIVKKSSDGMYYIYRAKRKGLLNIFLIKYHNNRGYIALSSLITIPKELIGKRCRIKLVLED